MWNMTFEKSLRMFSPKTSDKREMPDEVSRVLLREVCDTWVNGRRVLDGIPLGLRQQIVSALQLETGPVAIAEDIKVGCTMFRRGVNLSTVLGRIRRGLTPTVSGE